MLHYIIYDYKNTKVAVFDDYMYAHYVLGLLGKDVYKVKKKNKPSIKKVYVGYIKVMDNDKPCFEQHFAYCKKGLYDTINKQL